MDADIERVLNDLPPFPLLGTTHNTSEDLEAFTAPARELSRGGKRTRALFVLSGWQAGAQIARSDLERIAREPIETDTIHEKIPAKAASLPPALISLGTAMELYQLSALIHDDVIDEASTRRGIPTAHITFRQSHKKRHLCGDAAMYGRKMALLLGDYIFSLAAYTLNQALLADPTLNREACGIISQQFHSMTAEVAYGQYRDMDAEFTQLTDSTSLLDSADFFGSTGLVDSTGKPTCADTHGAHGANMSIAASMDKAEQAAFSVLYHKSARYSVIVPTIIGAVFGSFSTSSMPRATISHELERICLPLGEAFQLRDDTLGIFGDPRITGKPAGDDLSEGKRTVLVALARKAANAKDRAYIDAHLGQPISCESLGRIQDIIRSSGALQAHEQLIRQREEQAEHMLAASSLNLDVFKELTRALMQRTC